MILYINNQCIEIPFRLTGDNEMDCDMYDDFDIES